MNRSLLIFASTLCVILIADADAEGKRPGGSTGKNPPNGSKRAVSTDQSERPEERRLTLAIRDALLREKSLTAMAKGVTIVAANNRVTLSGDVASNAEKRMVCRLARTAAGEIPVDDRIKVRAAN